MHIIKCAFTTCRLVTDQGVDFSEGRKPKNPEKNPQSTREINNSTRIEVRGSTTNRSDPMQTVVGRSVCWGGGGGGRTVEHARATDPTF